MNIPEQERKSGCSIVFAVRRPGTTWADLAQKMSDNSRIESRILFRPADYFLEKIAQGCVIVATNDDEVIGAVCLHTLSPSFSEVGSAWVAENFRGKGVYSMLKDAMLDLARELGMAVISTARVSAESNSPGLRSSVSRGMLPMPFQELARMDLNAYQNCCCCDELRNHLSCPERDTTCILTVKVSNPADTHRSMLFIAGKDWSNANIHPDDKSKIQQQVLDWHRKVGKATAATAETSSSGDAAGTPRRGTNAGSFGGHGRPEPCLGTGKF
jgi:GNAT superfamily N-acetyltransferase